MSDRRRDILDAAQALFLEKGYSLTSIADIRDASGASVGSIYHAFGGKEAIAVALVERAVAEWTRSTEFAIEGGTIEHLVRATVAGLIRWAAGDPDAFLIMDQLRSISERGQADNALASALAQWRVESGAVIEAHARRGEIRAVSWPVAQALVLGPAYEFLRACRARLAPDEIEVIVTLLADAAWSALSPNP